LHIIPRRTACHAFPAKDAVRSALALLGGLIGEIDRSREMGATRATQAAPQQVAERLANLAGTAAERWRAQLGHYLPLIERILAQSNRHVLDHRAMLASEKLVNPFDLHADIIVKRYGHKLNLATGHSGLILDVVVEGGNPVELSTSCRCSSARSRFAACRRGRSPPIAAMPARTISNRPRRAAARTSSSLPDFMDDSFLVVLVAVIPVSDATVVAPPVLVCA